MLLEYESVSTKIRLILIIHRIELKLTITKRFIIFKIQFSVDFWQLIYLYLPRVFVISATQNSVNENFPQESKNFIVNVLNSSCGEKTKTTI